MTVLDTMNVNVVNATIAPPSDGRIYDDTNLPTSILKLNLDNKKLTPLSLQVSLTKDKNLKYADGEYQIEVSDADTGERIGIASSVVTKNGDNRYVSFNVINLPSSVRSLKFTPLKTISVGSNLSSKIGSVDYLVNFRSDINNALAWKSELDNSHTEIDYTRYELQLLDDNNDVQAQTAKTLSIYNRPVVAKLLDNKQSFFTPDDTVNARLIMPFEIVNTNGSVVEKLYDVSIDETALRSAFSSNSRLFREIIEVASYIDADGSLNKVVNRGQSEDSSDKEIRISAFLYRDTLKSGNHIYHIPIKIRPKTEFVKTADSDNVLHDGEVSALYTLITYNEYLSMTESKFKTTDSISDDVYVKDKDLSALTSVANLTRSDMSHLEAMAYIPKTGLEGSTVDTTLTEKVKSVDGWDVLYTTDQVSGSYKTDRNLNYVSEVDDYSKVTAVKFVSNRTVKQGDVATFDVKLEYSKNLGLKDSIRYRSVLLTENNDEVLSTPIIARETKPSPTTVKELFRPDLTDALTKRLYESLMIDGALMNKTDSLGGKVLFDENSKTISNFESSTIDSLEKRSLDRKLVSVDLSDQAGLFEHHRTEHQNSSDLDSQFANYKANKDLTVTNTGEQGSNATIIHYYRAAKGNIVERFVDESGVEIKSQTNSGDMIASYDYASYSHPDTIETDKATYEYSTQSGDQPYIVPEGTTTVTYVYRKVADKITYGSVIATYKDTEGNELTPQENVKTDVPDGEAYTTTAKTIKSSEVVEKTPEGLTKRTTTSYELTETPANATGNVVGNQTITVPYVYRKNVEERLVPGNTPTVDIPELKVTQYQTEDGTNIKDSEQGFVDAPNTIDKYQFTGTTNTNEAGDVQTHIYKVVEHEVPSDAPKREPEEIQITLHVDEETGEELVEYDPGLASPKEIEHYTYTGKTTQEEGIRIHYYKEVITEIPSDAPSVEIPELKATRYQTEDGTDVKDSETGFVDAPNMIGNYQFTGVTNTNEGGDVQTHIYKLIETKVPGDAPQVNIPELRLTRHVNEKGDELLPIEEGSNGSRKTIGDYEYTGRTDVEGGVTTHVYAPIRYEIPSDAPQYNIPELKVTRHVDEKDKELIETEKGIQPPRKTIGDHEYTGRTTEKDGITTHVYESIKHEVPGDTPIVDVPELKVTRYVNEKGEGIKESETGFIDAPKTIGDYEFTGKTELNDGKDVQTHIYKLVEKPVIPTPDPKNPEPKKPETPQPEAPKPIETPKSNDSVIVKSADQPQFVKNELPKTGETNSNLALVGVSVLTGLGSIGFIKRKREE